MPTATRRSALLPIAAALAIGAPVRAQTVAVTGGTVIDGTGNAPLPDGVVLIADGRIKAVGTAREVAVPAGATRIDARGKYLIPGLMDANLHLMINVDLETLIRYEDRFTEIAIEAAQLTLKTGQTTVFDTWGPRAALIKARDAIRSGQVTGSRVYLAGNIIGFDGPLSADFRGSAVAPVSKAFTKRINETWEQGTGRALMWMPPEKVRAIIREYTTKGVDFLKYGATGHQEMEFLQFSPRVQKAIVEEGHRAGMTVQAHTSNVEGLFALIDAGADIITHCETTGPTEVIPPETIKLMVERRIPCSTLPVTQRSLDAQLVSSPTALMTPLLKIKKQNQRNLIAAGAILLLSTDAGIQNPILAAESPTIAADTVQPRLKLGEGHFNVLVAFEEMGMKPMEILKSATSYIARAYHLDRDLGTLEPGKIADLVILDRDPLASARNYRSINTVIKDGKVVDLAALPTQPILSNLTPAKY
jgi:imidazolonepropionase-like amidohydrolase